MLAKSKGVDIVAICDTDLSKARALATRFGVPDVYDDIVEMLQRLRPEAVVVCTPNHLHEVHVLAALSAGVNVLCERPLAMTSRGVRKLLDAKRNSDRVLMVGMNLRFRNDVQAVRGFLNSHELGSVRAIRCGWYTLQSARVLGWRVLGTRAGGGAMLDLGLPLIDLALWLAGNPVTKRVSSQLGTERGKGDVEEEGCALVRCENDLSLFVDVSWNHVGDRERLWMDVVGSQGSASIGPLHVFKDINGKPVNVTPTGATGRENAFSVSYRAELAHFVAVLRGEVEEPGLDDQIRLHELLEAIQRSAAEGCEVEL
jgi:predicted dehydrogenase